jgi:DNA-binding IclR family transcriptional regulator
LTKTWGIISAGVELEDSGHMIVLAISRSRTALALNVDVGSQFPPLLSATGQVFAAFGDMGWPDLMKRFKSLQKHNPVDFSSWKKGVEISKRKGFSVDRGDYISGVTIIAVPVLNASGKLTHALVGGGLSDQFGATRVSALARSMQQEARRLSTLMLSIA